MLLGGRHLIYGVQDDEYQLFAHAMCDTFKFILGKNFTEQMARAWNETLMALAGLMKEAGEITAAGYQYVFLRHIIFPKYNPITS